MNDFFVRGLSFMALGAILVVLLPVLAQLLFTLGPIGFIVLMFVIFALGSVYCK